MWLELHKKGIFWWGYQVNMVTLDWCKGLHLKNFNRWGRHPHYITVATLKQCNVWGRRWTPLFQQLQQKITNWYIVAFIQWKLWLCLSYLVLRIFEIQKLYGKFSQFRSRHSSVLLQNVCQGSNKLWLEGCQSDPRKSWFHSAVLNLKLYSLSIHSSIHPSLTTYPESGHEGSSSSRGSKTSLSLPHQPALTGGSGGVPTASAEIKSLHLDLGLSWGLFPAGRAWNTSIGRWPGGILTRCLNPLIWLLLNTKEQLFNSKFLTDDWTSHFIPKGGASHPPEETHFSRLFSWSHSFGHDPSFMTIAEERNKNWPVDQELCLLAQLSFHHNSALQQAQNGSRCCDSLAKFSLHSSLTHERN